MEFDWDRKRKPWEMKAKGRPSFQRAIQAITNPRDFIGAYQNDTHPEQEMFLVWIGSRVYKVPFERRGKTCWLITVHKFEKTIPTKAREDDDGEE